MKCLSKRCFKCNREKPITEYYKHTQMKDGHLNKCKECTKIDNAINRNKRAKYYAKYDKKRSTNPERLAQRAAYNREYRKKNYAKYRARNILNSAIRDGKIEKPSTCSICNSGGQIEGHHADYSKPLEVEWFCSKCHKRVDRLPVVKISDLTIREIEKWRAERDRVGRQRYKETHLDRYNALDILEELLDGLNILERLTDRVSKADPAFRFAAGEAATNLYEKMVERVRSSIWESILVTQELDKLLHEAACTDEKGGDRIYIKGVVYGGTKRISSESTED